MAEFDKNHQNRVCLLFSGRATIGGVQSKRQRASKEQFWKMSDEQVMVADPAVEKEQKNKSKKQPRYNVILWDDSDHSYQYVVMMMRKLFRHPIEKGFEIATEVDGSGKAICLTTTMEHAELKRDQIHAYGKDDLIPRCKGSMSATIEPAG